MMRPRRALFASILLVVMTIILAPFAGATRLQGGERITSYDSEIRLDADGSIAVTERIDYDFGSARRHGIERFIPVVFEWNGEPPPDAIDGASYERVTPISDISVSASPGTPAQVELSDENGNKKLRIGDPDTTISGQHTYVISYTLEGVLNSFDDHDELYLDVIGTEWRVPILNSRATITLPGPSNRAECFTGQVYSQSVCDSIDADGDTVDVSQGELAAFEGLSVVVGMAKGVVTEPAETQILREVWSPATAFRLTPGTGLGAGVILLAGVGAVSSLLWRKGRDRRFAGGATDIAFGNYSGDDERVPLFDDGATTVEFVPPDGIRPGHMGTLWDEEAHHLDVSAMLVDLAVRGFLRIDEVETSGTFRRNTDFRLVKLRDAADAQPPLLAAEQSLLNGLFRDGDAPLLGDLKTTFASRLGQVQNALYEDTVAAGWFPTRPDRVRATWRVYGVIVTVLGAALCAALAFTSHSALIAVPVPLVGLAIVALAGRFPHRTARGTAVLTRVRGFKEIFDAGEGERQRWAEHRNLFTEYLPYAIVFGSAEKWAETFESLGLSPEEMGYGVWYTSSHAYHPFMMGRLVNDFSSASIGSMAAAAPSTSGGAASGGSGFGGGFSGGGFGGGGGGSW